MAEQVRRADSTEGDIDTLSQRRADPDLDFRVQPARLACRSDTGRKRRAKSKTDCLMRCMSG